MGGKELCIVNFVMKKQSYFLKMGKQYVCFVQLKKDTLSVLKQESTKVLCVIIYAASVKKNNRSEGVYNSEKDFGYNSCVCYSMYIFFLHVPTNRM